ncbi:PREDICTED: prominin-2 [Nanorana parkeri]|uniref:prominin-2 n=1 Tax=Nanorana parkeri TaxID=125878 RepID=UPI0008548473|nr:PREDICTED: prominin-2 [Nanorana parkeri]
MPYLGCEKMGLLDLRIGVWHLVIYCVLLHNMGLVAAQTCQLVSGSEELIFDEVGSKQNISFVRRHSDALAPLYNMQRLFLNAVQQNPFPKELLRVLFTNSSFLETAEVVKYEAGYVACAIIAILFIIFALVFGIIFCTFRYRGRKILPCEGALCAPTPIFLVLLFTLCFLFAGVVCTFYMNQKAHDEIGYGVQDFSKTLQDFRVSVSSIPQAITKVVTEFEVPKKRVYADLESFRPAINSTVNAKINNEIRPLLEHALQTGKDLEAAAQILLNVNKTLTDMKTRQKSLDTQLVRLQEDLLRVLSDRNCENCAEPSNIVRNIQLGQTQIPSLGELSSKLNNLKKINLPGIFQKVTNVRFMPNHHHYGHYNFGWIIGVVLCCVLLLISACTALGLIFGLWGLYLLQDPESSLRRRRDGAGFLVIQMYLTFIFSWLLILFVFITFLVGGNIQTLMCKHWVNGDIYKFLDDPQNLPNNINLKKQIGLRENTSFTDMYNECKKGSPIWDVLQFSNPIDLDSAFNLTQYTSDLEEKINNFTLNVAALNLMSFIAVRVLQEYNNSDVDQVPFNSILQQIHATLVTLQNVQGFVPMLETLSLIQSNATIRSQLKEKTGTLKNILNTAVRDQEAALRTLNDSLSIVASLAPTLKAGIQRTIEDINFLNGPLVEQFIERLRNESKCLLNQALGYFSKYIDWVKTTITQNIASCRSVPATLDNARVIVCDNVSHPWNGFWFCLGWCTILLIPNIFLSIKSEQHIAPKSRSPKLEEENLFPLTHNKDEEDEDPGLREGRSPYADVRMTTPSTVY